MKKYLVQTTYPGGRKSYYEYETLEDAEETIIIRKGRGWTFKIYKLINI
jgi:hypothetical protein